MHFLITGMSGTGKSTVIDILRERGYAAVETDEPQWLFAGDGHDSEWLWDEAKVAKLLDAHRGTPLFVVGTRENQGRLYDRFDHIVLFTAPLEVVLQRVAARHKNPYGSRQSDRDKIAAEIMTVEPLLRSGATIEIDTSALRPEEIADRLIALL